MNVFNIEIWIDGACSGNPGPMGAGIVLKCGEKVKKISVPLGQGTNNRAEFLALKHALESIKYPEQSQIVVYTDSQLVVRIFSQGWRAKSNLDVVTEISALLPKFQKIMFKKVQGHAGIELNEEADRLAKLALKM